MKREYTSTNPQARGKLDARQAEVTVGGPLHWAAWGCGMDVPEIKIACSAADRLPLDAIEDFQGGLKKRGKREIEPRRGKPENLTPIQAGEGGSIPTPALNEASNG